MDNRIERHARASYADRAVFPKRQRDCLCCFECWHRVDYTAVADLMVSAGVFGCRDNRHPMHTNWACLSSEVSIPEFVSPSAGYSSRLQDRPCRAAFAIACPLRFLLLDLSTDSPTSACAPVQQPSVLILPLPVCIRRQAAIRPPGTGLPQARGKQFPK